MHQSIGVGYGTFPYNFSGQYINTKNWKHLNIWTLESIQFRKRILPPAASNPPLHGPVPSHYSTKECDQTTNRNNRTSVPNLSRLINYTASRKPRSKSDIRMMHINPLQRRSFETPMPDKRGLLTQQSYHLSKPKPNLPAQINSDRVKDTILIATFSSYSIELGLRSNPTHPTPYEYGTVL